MGNSITCQIQLDHERDDPGKIRLSQSVSRLRVDAAMVAVMAACFVFVV